MKTLFDSLSGITLVSRSTWSVFLFSSIRLLEIGLSVLALWMVSLTSAMDILPWPCVCNYIGRGLVIFIRDEQS